MSLYSDIGREKLANWLLNCLYIDLVICGFFLFLNISVVFETIRVNPLEIAIILGCFLIYAAVINGIKEKILKYREDVGRYLSEIAASMYLFVHSVFYFLIIGAFFSEVYRWESGIQVSSDFLFSWAIILSIIILAGFYLKNKETQRSSGTEHRRMYRDSRWDYPDGHLSTEDRYSDENDPNIPVIRETEEQRFQREQYRTIRELQNANIPADLNCYICGKRDLLPLQGSDGRYYCRDHILPENRVRSPDFSQPSQNSEPKPDTRCKNPFCRKEIFHGDIIKCGPCGKLFCKHCWEEHRWVHGKSPAVGICYTADGKFHGFDGSEDRR